MNKAFVKEPDNTGQGYCPRCGSLGVAVQEATLRAQLVEESLSSLSSTAYFCPFARCEVAYFDSFERMVTIDRLRRGVYPKDPNAPICACFGLTRDDVEQDVREGGVARVRALLEKTRTPEARCATQAADGRCCMPEVQRYFMKLRHAETP